MRPVLLSGLALLASAVLVPAVARSPLPETAFLLRTGQFAKLESTYERLWEHADRTTSLYFGELGFGTAENRWLEDDRDTRAWLAEYPDSTAAAIARAMLLSRRAREEIPWKEAEALLEEAEQRLRASRTRGRRDLAWHGEWLSVGRQQGWNPSRIRQAVEDGVQQADSRFRPNLMHLYQEAIYALAPDRRRADGLRWLARFAVDHSLPGDGQAMYARIYLRAAESNWAVRDHPFGAGGIEWTTMNRALLDLYNAQRGSYVLNHHAALACRAGDKATTAALLGRISREVLSDMWRQWGGEPLYENCRIWATEGSRPA